MTCRFIRSLFVLPIISLCLLSIVAGPLAVSLLAADDGIVFRTVTVEDENEDPVAAGKAAGEKLLKAMGDTRLKAVLISECFEDREYKEELLKGLRSALPEKLLIGGATYGSFSQSGCADFDAVCLLGIGGKGIDISTALVDKMGITDLKKESDIPKVQKRLTTAGQQLAKQLKRSDKDQLCIVMADAHSPKNQYLVDGLQKVLGKEFPITGGSVNKNAGQTFVYYEGKVYPDAAVALMISGDFKLSMSGRQAKENEAVISSAKSGAAEALKKLDARPIAVLAFNCAGRRGKLTRLADELEAIQSAIGKETPMFGCYNAGEIGPADKTEKTPGVLSTGNGWHVMFTIIGK